MDINRKRAQLIACCIMLVLVSIPLIFRVVPPNALYGFRTHATQSSRAIWYPANAFMGWAVSIAAVISAVALWRLPPTVTRWKVWATFLVPLSAALAASLAYLNRLV